MTQYALSFNITLFLRTGGVIVLTLPVVNEKNNEHWRISGNFAPNTIFFGNYVVFRMMENISYAHMQRFSYILVLRNDLWHDKWRIVIGHRVPFILKRGLWGLLKVRYSIATLGHFTTSRIDLWRKWISPPHSEV